ncbi:hypothetical protein ASPACDRAFT_34589 [Aspergillus aculeatus ATCC 16872]|uniref:Uncharacterized protein n=1 Tax=Aspergillus aculeatus (strain ATCC 16872 / CBS 172.66 / WB 5094) TaxID=690307 RepID=A0A1L9WKA4_ASPA1|nr:uncharacterized protein ASPACDRAFT_34589 [Aspergillus aculeatus ATCC 16872]OJJ96585.1 hypothetical protein ASPACDRAFT_34589 [Aspergillus aculeatus ATCC 16872]
MSKARDDETRWFPIGQTVETPSRAARRTSRAVKDGDDDNDDDDGATFAFAAEDMGKLNRYLHGGRVLPRDKDSFCQKVGILDQSKLTDHIWTQINSLIGTYNEASRDCTDFLGGDSSSENRRQWTKEDDGDDSAFDALCTFDKMNTLASQIYGYADTAGADDSSYYRFMLDKCREYNDEDATEEQRQKAQKAIQDVTEDLLSDIEPMQRHAKKVSDALAAFEKACEKRESALGDSEASMTTILNDDLGDISDLQQKIVSQLKDIDADQKIIDADRYDQEMTAAYVWIPIMGTIAGSIVFAERQADIEKYEKKIAALKELISSEQEKIALHQLLQGHVTSMSNQCRDLKALIGPARETAEKLEGGWNLIGAEVKVVHDTAERFENKIPGVDFAEYQLQTIVDEWKKLYKGVREYIKTAPVLPRTDVMSIDDYHDQIKNLIN